MALPTTNLGLTNLKITRMGLGSMPLAIGNRPKRDDAIEVIHRTLDLGVTLIDTADAYCADENDKNYCEKLIYDALQTYRGSVDIKKIIIATKGGLIRPGGAWETDLNPTRLRHAIRQSYESLGGKKAITLWQLHNSPQDEKYTLKEIFEPICEAVQLKLIEYVGVSNFNLEQIQEAQTYTPIHSVQNVYNLFKRAAETDGVLKYCEDNQITFLAYSPMGGRRKHKKLNKDPLLIQLSQKYHCSTYCIVLTWMLSKWKCLVPIPGASHLSSIQDSVKAFDIHLDNDDIQLINNHRLTLMTFETRPRLCRSDHQPNLLEYIDTTLNESLAFTRTISNNLDQYGNTIFDQYLVYLLCQKINPNRTDEFSHLLHQLILFEGKISKSIFESSSLLNINRTVNNSYLNFIWNEFDVNILLELGCFLLKYRLSDLFSYRQQRIMSFFLEIFLIYYLSYYHSEYFQNSRSIDMIFPSPSVYIYSSLPTSLIEQELVFEKFLQLIFLNGEIYFDQRQIKHLLQTDHYQFLNKKFENKKIGLINFMEKTILHQQTNFCRSLKSLCRIVIKKTVQHYPDDIKKLSLYPSINEQLQNFLIYSNSFAFESFV